MQAQRQACSVMISTLQGMSDIVLDWAKKKVDKSSKLVSALASTPNCGVPPVLFDSTGSMYSQRVIGTAHIAMMSHARLLPHKSGSSRRAAPAVTDMRTVPSSFFA